MNLDIVTLSQRPELEPALWNDELMNAWPMFVLEDPMANLYFAPGRLERFREYILVAVDEDRPDVVLGRAFSVPFCLGDAVHRPELPSGGWDTVVRWGDQDHLLGRTPNAVSALEITLHPSLAGRGLSYKMVTAMRDNAARLGFNELYAPVRPSHKQLEPMTPMAEYARRTRDDGLPADPWLRVHVRLGGKLIKIAPHSMVVAGTLDAWRRWTGLPFDQSGTVTVPGALAPVHVSVAQDHAVYVEPNVWMRHRLA